MTSDDRDSIDAVKATSDPDALMCAIAVEPSAISRNRHFELYRSDLARRAHKRAHTLRRLASQLRPLIQRGQLLVEHKPGSTTVRYRDPGLALTRTVVLRPVEALVLKVLIADEVGDEHPGLELTAEESSVVRRALASLGVPWNTERSKVEAKLR